MFKEKRRRRRRKKKREEKIFSLLRKTITVSIIIWEKRLLTKTLGKGKLSRRCEGQPKTWDPVGITYQGLPLCPRAQGWCPPALADSPL